MKILTVTISRERIPQPLIKRMPMIERATLIIKGQLQDLCRAIESETDRQEQEKLLADLAGVVLMLNEFLSERSSVDGARKSYELFGAALDQSFNTLDQAVMLGSDNPLVYDARGQLFTQMGLLEAALDDYYMALDMHPTADRCYRHGLTLSRLGRAGEALAFLEKAVELDPRHVKAITERGTVRMNLGRADLVREDFDAAIRLDPTYHVAWGNRAAYYYLRKEWKEASEDASQALKLKPNYALPYKLRGLANKEAGLREEAIADLERFFALDPQAKDRLRLGVVLKHLKQTTKTQRRCGWFSKLFKE
jgi:tetratricopeptide (TPR) repeat protein